MTQDTQTPPQQPQWTRDGLYDAWRSREDRREDTVDTAVRYLNAQQQRIVALGNELESVRNEIRCGRCGHYGHEHGDTNPTQLPWATEYFPECMADDCECEGFIYVPAIVELESRVEALEAALRRQTTLASGVLDYMAQDYVRISSSVPAEFRSLVQQACEEWDHAVEAAAALLSPAEAK